MTPEQRAEIAALMERLEREMARVNVQHGVGHRLREAAPRTEERIDDNSTRVTLALDVSRIVSVLETLPDGAGTDAFVDAYNRSAQ